jgi:amidophosphoribosyltransferase
MNPEKTNKEIREECGVFAISSHKKAFECCVLGLHALQHRGQEAAGIVTVDQDKLFVHTSPGYVHEIFRKISLPGESAIGHVRYSTSGNSLDQQPIYANINIGELAIAHNGNLTNTSLMRRQLESKGCIFQTSIDTEIFVHLIATSKHKNLLDSLKDACRQVKGAYSVVLITKDQVIGLRDPLGIRPLVLGKLEDSYVIASESCALDMVDAKLIRDINPGEIIILGKNSVDSTRIEPAKRPSQKFCIFEYVYFARPDSIVEKKSVYETRKAIGRVLAKEHRIEADMLVPLPDSGIPMAIGYAENTKIPLELGIICSHYTGRTFIEPTQNARDLAVKLKHNINRAVVAGKKIILIDDSIVRGTTTKRIAKMLKGAGAKEVHLCIGSPPFAHPCFYGINTPNKEHLLAANYSIEGMNRIIGSDSLSFISLEGLYEAMGVCRNNNNPQYCDACLSGEYPIDTSDISEKPTIPLL